MKLSVIFHFGSIIIISIILSGILVSNAYGDYGIIQGTQSIPSEGYTPNINSLPQAVVENRDLSTRIDTIPVSDIEHSVNTPSRALQIGIAPSSFRTGKTSLSGSYVNPTQTGQTSSKVTDEVSNNCLSPTITSISPSSAMNTAPVSITNLSGTGFKAGVKVILTRIGRVPIFGTEVAISDNFTKITCTLPITGKPAGSWNVVVVNTDGQAAIIPNGFLITSPAPTITSITPSSGVNTAPVFISNLSGTGFQKGAIIKFTQTGQPDIVAINVQVISSGKIMCTLPISGKTTGAWNVVVVNRDGQSGMLNDAFTIRPPLLFLNSITPSSGVNTAPVVISNLSGTGFQPGVLVKLTHPWQAPIIATGVLISDNNTKISCNFPITGKPAGSWNIVVTNTDGETAIIPNGFIISTPAPTITSITPSSGVNTAPVLISNLSGTGFQRGAIVKLTQTGKPDIFANNVHVVSSGKITCNIPINGKAAGAWNVVVTNTDGKTAIMPNGFTITGPPAPTILSITPSSVNPTANCKVTITGTNFRSNPTVKITKGFVTKIATIQRTTRTQIMATLPTARMAPGVYTLTVQNRDGSSATLNNAFTVNSAGNNPTLTAINPKTGLSSANTKVTLTGTNFREGAIVQMIKGSTVRNAQIKSRISTKIVCILPTKGTRAGVWDLVIRNRDKTMVTKTGSFTVKRGGVASNQAEAGSTSAILLNSQQSVFGSGISPGSNSLPGRVRVPDISLVGSSVLH